MTPVKKEVEQKDTWTLVTHNWVGMPQKWEYFYEGELIAKDGVIEVPKTRPEWAQRLLATGYEWPDGKAPEDWHGVS